MESTKALQHPIAFNKAKNHYEISNLDKPLLQSHVFGAPSLPRYHKDTTSRGSSFARTCFNTMNSISGIGVLSMPYALSVGGWLSLPIFAIVAIISYYTGLLIQHCMDVHDNIKTYGDIGHYAFGNKGKIIISMFMHVELYLVAVSFLILEGDNLNSLFPGTTLDVFSLFRVEGNKMFILVAAAMILPTTWLRNLGMLAYVSAGGVLASMVLLCSLIWGGIEDVGFKENGRVFNFSGLPTALGLFFVCFTCHAVFPTIHSSMSDSKQFSKVLSISFFLCTLNYALMAVVGYLMFGDNLKSQVTLNLSSGKLYSRIAIYTTLINPFTKFALAIAPIAMAIEERVTWCKRSTAGCLIVRSLLLASTVLIALTIPFFAYLMAFIGSFLSITVSVLFPCVCYLKIFGTLNLSSLELVSIVLILIIGSLVAVTGTYASLCDIIYHM